MPGRITIVEHGDEFMILRDGLGGEDNVIPTKNFTSVTNIDSAMKFIREIHEQLNVTVETLTFGQDEGIIVTAINRGNAPRRIHRNLGGFDYDRTHGTIFVRRRPFDDITCFYYE